MKKKFLKFILPMLLLVAATLTIGPSCSGELLGNTIGDPIAYSEISAGHDHSIAKKLDGTLWSWGLDTTGQLGNSSISTSTSNPEKIGTDTNWDKISAGYYHNLALKTDGTLWAWGSNSYGELGNGTLSIQKEPIQIGTRNDWKYISAGGNHSLAIKTDGTLWAWGRNDNTGQLGDGTTINKNKPVQIGTDTDWAVVSAGDHHSAGVKTDGTLFMWGSNDEGQFGVGAGNTKGSLTPLSTANVASKTTWKTISCGNFHTIGIKTDGTMWGSGTNSRGQLGIGSIVSQNTFTKIGTSANWIMVSAGMFNSIAISSNGTTSQSKAYSWGANDLGQSGDNTNIDILAPVLIANIFGNTDNYLRVSAGGNHTLTILSTSWNPVLCSGKNDFGQLGDGSNINKKIFVRVTQ